jgi:hypothetical protein
MGFPYWESYGFTTFRLPTSGRVRCLRVRRWPYRLRAGKAEPVHPATHLLVQAYQRLWLVGFHDVYPQFTYVAHTVPS